MIDCEAQDAMVSKPGLPRGLPTARLTIWWTIALAVGCSSHPPTIPVSGTVTHAGKPLERATVVFKTDHPKTGRPLIATGITDPAGRFTLLSRFGPRDVAQGVVPGRHRVTVSKFVPPGTMTAEEYQRLADLHSRAVAEKGPAAATGAPPPMVQLLAPAYSDAAGSKLSADVARGEKNDFVFDLD